MDKRYYDATDLSGVLKVFEQRYGMTSLEFFQEHLHGGPRVDTMSGFHRQAWAGFFRAWQRMAEPHPRSNGMITQVQRELEIA